MNKALLIIDVQNDYFPGGRCELFQPYEALVNVKKLIDKARSEDMPIIYIQHVGGDSATFLKELDPGAEIKEEIKPMERDIVIQKHYPSSFLKTTLKKTLDEKGIEELYVCGMMSHMCVDTTVRAASDLGYTVTLFDDACTTMNLEWNGQVIPAATVHDAFMSAMAGAFASVIPTAQWCD